MSNSRVASKTAASTCPLHSTLRRVPVPVVICLLLIVGALVVVHAQSLPAPAGWSLSTSGPNAIYRPDNLPSDRTFLMTIAPSQPLAGQSLTVWFTAQVQFDLEMRGAQAHLGNPQSNPDGTLLMLVPYKDRAGRSWIAVYVAATRPHRPYICRHGWYHRRGSYQPLSQWPL
jgi:hypothetical protein